MPRRKVESPLEIPAPPLVVSEPAVVERPALTIVIQSWSTPIVGALMLAVGLAFGVLFRPGNAWPWAAASPTPTRALEATAPPTTDPSQARQAFMNTLIAQTRHFRGDPQARVTMIEFSDFQ